MSCSSRLRKLLLPLLKAVKEGRRINFRMRSAAEQAIFLIGKPTSNNKIGRPRRVSRRSTKNEETAALYAFVEKRAGGSCECGCERMFGHSLSRRATLDHWLGGGGRRKERQSPETAWMLSAWCHLQRTNNAPEAGYWNHKFQKHCERYGYPVIEHIIHEPIARKAQ